jgi:photosystem II stability/assembly factor-like uncharacterized protein
LNRAAESGAVCPDAEVLAAYVDGGLDAGELERVESHLVTCPSCRALMARLSPTVGVSVHVGGGWRVPRVDPKWLSLAAMIVVGATLWAVFPRTSEGPAGIASADKLAQARPAEPGPGAAARMTEATPAAPAASALADAEARRQVNRPKEEEARRTALQTLPAGPRAGGRTAGAPAAPADAAVGGVAGPAPAPTPSSFRGTSAPAPARPAPPPAPSVVSPPPAESPRVAAAAPPTPPSGAASAAGPQMQQTQQTQRTQQAQQALAEAVGRERAAADTAAATAPAAPATAVPSTAATARAETDARRDAGRDANAMRQVSSFAGARGAAKLAAEAGAVAFAEPEGRLLFRIVGSRYIESSSNGGEKWNTVFDGGRSMRLLAGSAPSLSVSWACGAGGVVLRRVSPGGWGRVKSPTSEDLASIVASSESSARVTTRAGVVFETTDGGATWAPQ